MAEMIVKDALIAKIKAFYCIAKACEYNKAKWNGVGCKACWVGDMIDEIENASTIEAEPVRRGKWIRTSTPYAHSPVQHCSECGCNTNADMNYCPDCGAKMTGGGTDAG